MSLWRHGHSFKDLSYDQKCTFKDVYYAYDVEYLLVFSTIFGIATFRVPPGKLDSQTFRHRRNLTFTYVSHFGYRVWIALRQVRALFIMKT